MKIEGEGIKEYALIVRVKDAEVSRLKERENVYYILDNDQVQLKNAIEQILYKFLAKVLGHI